ncbi:MAG: hypothetical protein JSU74_03935 [Candidatus Zixiibacteriota bacterium]|nr:MAG: hypothetical protein JSU74_03935 [candidate division Zixibacteria bacterium]
MVRKLRLILPILFVFAFAFTLVVSMHNTAAAGGPCDYLDPRPGCCILAIHCNVGQPECDYWVCGYGIWVNHQCVKTSSMDCPQPAACVPCP